MTSQAALARPGGRARAMSPFFDALWGAPDRVCADSGRAGWALWMTTTYTPSKDVGRSSPRSGHAGRPSRSIRPVPSRSFGGGRCFYLTLTRSDSEAPKGKQYAGSFSVLRYGPPMRGLRPFRSWSSYWSRVRRLKSTPGVTGTYTCILLKSRAWTSSSALNRGLSKALGAEKSEDNALLRPPGSFNHKGRARGDGPYPVIARVPDLAYDASG